MQYAEEAWGIGADVFRIGGKRPDRAGGSFEERAVAHALVGTQEGAQFLGHGEGQHEVVGGQFTRELAREPGIAFVLLAAWAVAVAAAARQHLVLAAILAAIED